MTIEITSGQLGLLHHTLGINERRRSPFRNHFMAGPGHYAQADLEALESHGLMVRGQTPGFCDPGDALFRVTEAGREHAIAALPAPRKRSRYEEYLDADVGYSFAEFLGIEVPQRDYSRDRRTPKHFRLVSKLAKGGYAPTLKDAKASYKAALAAQKVGSA